MRSKSILSYFIIVFTLLIFILSVSISYIPPQDVTAQIDDSPTPTTTIQEEFSTYENSTYGISIQYPSNWVVEELDYDATDRVTNIVTFYAPLDTYNDKYEERLTITLDDIPYDASLEEYLQEAIDTYKNIEIVESNINASTLSGFPAYSLTYTWKLEPAPEQEEEEQAEEEDDEENDSDEDNDMTTKEIGALVSRNKGYYIEYHAEEDSFSDYQPTIQKMIDSFEISQQVGASQEIAETEEDVSPTETTTTVLDQNFKTYVNSTYGVSMQYPSSDWEIYEQDLSPSDSVTDIVTFSSPIKSFVDSYPESVGIRIDNLQNASITLDEYLDYTINSYKESYPYFNIIESSADSILTNNNNSAYRLIYTTKNPEQNLELKGMETGIIIEDKAYYITYFAEEKRYSEYLPVVERMIDSFKITDVPSVNEEEQIEEQPKRVKYSLPEDNTQFITLSYDQWVSDDLNVMILVNPDTQEQSSKYLKQVEDAISKWSEALKDYSGNDYAWNFNITTSVGYLSSVKPDQAVDITVAITGDPEGVACNDILGIAPPHPYNLALPVIVNVLTSCINESQEVIEFPPDVVYSTVLHEFAHSLGLGHAFNMNNDLMCSGEVDINGNPFNTCEYYEANVAEISGEDINALLYKYGKDGFKLPNRDLKGETPYYEIGTSID